MNEYMEQTVAEQATGCSGAGAYRQWAKARGYKHLAVVDWTSSAGDWCFIVSKGGKTWHPMFQENNYPRAGFTRTIDLQRTYYGTESEVLQQIYEEQLIEWGE